ncbi:MAG TPA: hypothetical protein VF550_15350, partial [Polyangia bacterium]
PCQNRMPGLSNEQIRARASPDLQHRGDFGRRLRHATIEYVGERVNEVNQRYRELLDVAIADQGTLTEGRFSCEGTALVRLAGRLGMQIASSYQMVPHPV